MKTSKFQLETLSCPSCIKKIENTLGKQPGVKEVKVLFNSSKVKASHDEAVISADEIGQVIEKLGYPVLSVK